MAEGRQLDSKNMAKKTEDMKEKSTAMRQVTRRKMADIEEKEEEMARNMTRKLSA